MRENNEQNPEFQRQNQPIGDQPEIERGIGDRDDDDNTGEVEPDELPSNPTQKKQFPGEAQSEAQRDQD